MTPDRLTLRSYAVGFGDCFLLSFHYDQKQRHVLIDFGSTGRPDGAPKSRMKDIADDIAAVVGKEPFAVVATHRHADHISGFATDTSAKTGQVIAALKPRFVTQPWTEDPAVALDAKAPNALQGIRAASAHKVRSLNAMQEVAAQFLREATRRGGRKPAELRQIGFIGENNIANRSAVKNLMTMAENEYLHFGKKTRLARLLPGVEIDVLGPPTVKQHDGVRKQRHEHEDEFWHLMSVAGRVAAVPEEDERPPLFPRYETGRINYRFAPDARWLIRHARALRNDQMLRIVRALDSALNNTSVILLFRVGGKSLLFPGDAQIENWEFALSQPDVVKKLEAVDLYKVGHHGSLNATPKTLWGHFAHKSTRKTDPQRLTSVMSTMLGKHGDEKVGTEVPREKLTAALRRHSHHFTTQSLAPNELCHMIEIDL
jgi:hypothetical protein